VFRELEDPHKSDDSEEGEGGTGLGWRAAHRGQDLAESDVEGDDSEDVDEVLEVLPEVNLRGTGYESNYDLYSEPWGARRLHDEEWIGKVWRGTRNTVTSEHTEDAC